MRVLAGALIGATSGLGLLLIVGGALGRRWWGGAGPAGVITPGGAGAGVPPGGAMASGAMASGVTGSTVGRWMTWSALSMSAFGVGWLVTGWPAFGATTAAGLLVLRRAAVIGRRRVHQEAMADALAGWAEILADVMRSHSGLGQAVRETAPHTAAILRPWVMLLSTRIQTGPLSTALAKFAADVDHPTADLLVAALRLAGDGGGRNLPDVLRTTATRTRARAEMLQRVEAGRARLYSEARAMVAVTGSIAAAAVVFGRSYLVPYDTGTGQLVLVVVGALFCAAGLALAQLGRPTAVAAPLGPPDGNGVGR